MTQSNLQSPGNYTQTKTGNLFIDIGGTATSAYDQINVSGRLVFDGTLNVNLINGFIPKANDTFKILTFNSSNPLAWKFEAIELPDLSQYGLEFIMDSPEQMADNDLTLTVKQLSEPQAPAANKPINYQIAESDDIGRAEVVPRDVFIQDRKVTLTSPRTDVRSQSSVATELIGNNLYKDGSDVDIFGISLLKGDKILIDVDARNNDGTLITGLKPLANSTLKSAIQIFRANGTRLQPLPEDLQYDTGEAPSADPLRVFTAPDTGTYYIGISAQGNETYNPRIADKNASGKVDPGTAHSKGAYQLELTLLQDGVNDPIAVSQPLANQTALEDQPFAFIFAANTFYDDEGDSLTYIATLKDGTALPAWLNFNASTRTFTGTPTDTHLGVLEITVTAQDNQNEIASDTFVLRVNGVNDKPTLTKSISNQKAAENVAFRFTLPADTFTDVDPGDVLTYSATLADGSPLPTWLKLDAATRTFSGKPTSTDISLLDIKVTAKDLMGETASDTFSLAVGVNTPPSGTNKTITTNEDTTYTFTEADFGFSDIDQDTFARVLLTTVPTAGTLMLNATALNAGTFVDVTEIRSGKLTFIPAGNASGTNYTQFTFQVEDNGGTALGGVNLDSTPNTLTVNVTPINDTPTLVNPIADQQASKNAAFSFTVPNNTFADVDPGDTLTYTATLANGAALPNWLSFNATTRTFSGIPSQPGNFNVLVTARDRSGATVSDAFALTVPTQAGLLSFSAPEYQVKEDGTAVLAVTVNRTNGTDGNVSATLTLSDGTATAGTDYDNQPLSVDFAAGETSRTVVIPILDDSSFEADETLNLALGSPTEGATIGTQRTAVLTIVDNDTQPNPTIPGTSSHDNLVGTAGADTFVGVNTRSTTPGRNEKDVFTGGSGGDRFILGDANRVYYDDVSRRSPGLSDYALIKDFSLADGDVIQLKGTASHYALGDSPLNGVPGTAIFLTAGQQQPELIGIAQGTSLSNFNRGFAFV